MKKLLSFGIIAITTPLLLAGCGKKEEHQTISVASGDTVTISYTATTRENIPTIVDENITKVIEIGRQEIFNTFDEVLLGKKVGDTVEVTVLGKKIYSNRFRDGNIQEIPTQVFTQSNMKVITGQKLDLGEMKGVVTKITDQYVTIDTNPDYLDKNIIFDITIKDIQRKE